MQEFVKTHEEFINYVKELIRSLLDFIYEVHDKYEMYRDDVPGWIAEIITIKYPDLLTYKEAVISDVLTGVERLLYEFTDYKPIIYVIPLWKLLLIKKPETGEEYYETCHMVLPFVIGTPPGAVVDPCMYMMLSRDVDHLLLYVMPIIQLYSKRYQLCDLLQSLSYATYFAILIEKACNKYAMTGEAPEVPFYYFTNTAYILKDIFFDVLLRLLELKHETPRDEDIIKIVEIVKQEITLDEIFKSIDECFPPEEEERPIEEIRECLRNRVIIPNKGFSIAEIG